MPPPAHGELAALGGLGSGSDDGSPVALRSAEATDSCTETQGRVPIRAFTWGRRSTEKLTC